MLWRAVVWLLETACMSLGTLWPRCWPLPGALGWVPSQVPGLRRRAAPWLPKSAIRRLPLVFLFTSASSVQTHLVPGGSAGMAARQDLKGPVKDSIQRLLFKASRPGKRECYPRHDWAGAARAHL